MRHCVITFAMATTVLSLVFRQHAATTTLTRSEDANVQGCLKRSLLHL